LIPFVSKLPPQHEHAENITKSTLVTIDVATL
jgi:hypothetical protein